MIQRLRVRRGGGVGLAIMIAAARRIISMLLSSTVLITNICRILSHNDPNPKS